MKYKISCRINGNLNDEEIECSYMRISDGAYTFYERILNTSAHTLIASYPVIFSIVKRINEEDERSK